MQRRLSHSRLRGLELSNLPKEKNWALKVNMKKEESQQIVNLQVPRMPPTS